MRIIDARHHSLVVRLFFFCFILTIGSTRVDAQPQGFLVADPGPSWTPQFLRVAQDYTVPVDAIGVPNGAYIMARNKNGRTFNFSVRNMDGRMEVIPMADPTVLVIGDTVYVTGTCDSARTANFLIYKSKDLIHWEPHKTAFHESFRRAGSSLVMGDEERTLRLQRSSGGNPWGENYIQLPNSGSPVYLYELLAPHLYMDPTDPTFVYLSFTATAFRPSGTPPTPYDTLGQRTAYVARLLTSDFLLAYKDVAPNDTTKYFSTGTFGQNIDFYKYNAGTPSATYWDGGHSVGAFVATSAYGVVASCSSPTQPPGTAFLQVSPPAIGYCATAQHPTRANRVGLDTFVHYDFSNTPHLLYTYFDYVNGGNAIASQKMASSGSNRLFGAHVDPSSPLQLLASHGSSANTCDSSGFYNGVDMLCPAPWLSGTVRRDSIAFDSIEEAPSAFTRGSYTYSLFSRNAWDSSAYGIVYKRISGGIGTGGIASVDEWPLINSSNKLKKYGESFGHGEVFKLGDTYYLACHYKEEAVVTGPGQGGFPNIAGAFGATGKSTGGRTVFFKELRFGAEGVITSLRPDSSEPERDPNIFLVSRSLVLPHLRSAGDLGNSNGDPVPDGGMDIGDLLLFLNWFDAGAGPTYP